jgi:methionine synthase II (cobalamin-independent)
MRLVAWLTTPGISILPAGSFAEEYRAVVAAGSVLQIDDPGLPDWWDMLKPEPTIEAYRKIRRLRIDAVNHALVGIPEEKVRYHLCWGSWHGQHTHDRPLEHIIDLILEVKAQTYSFEAGNVRHEHEWRIWQGADAHKIDEMVRQSPERGYDIGFFDEFARAAGWTERLSLENPELRPPG